MSRKKTRRRRPLKKTVRWIGGLMAVVLLLTALGPTLVSWGIAHGLLRAALQRRINGTVAFDEIKLAWFGSQSVSAITITAPGGEEVAKLDVRVNAGLLALLTRRADSLTVDLSGTLSGELREDGSTSFADLLVTNEPDAAEERRRKPQAQPPASLRGLPATTLRIDDLTVRLRDTVSQRMITLDGATGRLAYAPGERTSVRLETRTASEELNGSLAVTGDIEHLFDRDGVMTLDRASGRIEIVLRRVPLPFTDRPTEIRSMRLVVSSDDLTSRVDMTIDAEAVIDGAEAGRLEGTLAVERPFKPDGSADLSLDRLTGRIVGRSVPTALFQPALAGTPIIASRDIGPTLDVDATFSADAKRAVQIIATSDMVQLDLTGMIDPEQRSIRGERLRLTGHVSPQLLASATTLRIDRPMAVEVDLSAFSLPPRNDGLMRQLRQASATGKITVRAPVTLWPAADSSSRFTIDNFVVQVDTTGLADGLTVVGSANIDDAPATLDCSITSLFGDDGSLALDTSTPIGTATLKGLKPATLVGLMPEHADIITAAVAGPIDITLVTTLHDDQLHATLHVSGAGLNLEMDAIRRGESLHVAESHAALTITPELAAALRQSTDEAIVLTKPSTVTVTFEPFDITRRPMGDVLTGPIRAHLTSDDVVLDQVPGLVEPIVLRQLTAEITAQLGDPPSFSADGQIRLHQAKTDQGVAILRYSVTAANPEVEPVADIDIAVRGLLVRRLERMMGKDHGTISDWIGKRGELTATVVKEANGYRASLSTDFPHLAGDFVAALDGDMVILTAQPSTLSLSRAALQRRLTPPHADAKQAGAAESSQAAITVPADVPLSLTINQLRFPRAMLEGRPFDAAAVEIDLAVTGGPLVISDRDHARSSLDHLELTIRSRDLAQGLDVTLAGEVTASGAVEPHPITLNGTLSGLMDEQGVLAPHQLALDMTVGARGTPTAVIDAVGNLRGLLVAAVGSTMDLQATATGFSRTTGSLQARIDTPHGWLEGRVNGRNNALQIVKDTPLRAELQITPPLRERLLYKIHPILADIRSTEQPMRGMLSNAVIPLDGDVSRLTADVQITIGAVELDSGSVTLGVLALFNAPGAATIPGSIEPIVARIRKGVVTYERFAVKIDTYTLVYSGRIDLNTRSVDLRTEIPLQALAMRVKELRGYADTLIVPLVTRGRFGQLKTELDPDFDLAKAALESGVRGLLNDALKDEGIQLGDLFDEIFKKKDKPKSHEQ